jgi:RNA polymerase sigma-70 factor, ECF subfamily
MDVSTVNKLLSRIALQDRSALKELYDGVAGQLLAVALRVLHDRAAAEDVLQDAFVTVWTRASQYPAVHSHAVAWLTSLVRNRAIDVVRRVRPEVPLHWDDADGQEHQHDVIDEAGRTPIEQLSDRQTDRQLDDCLLRLEAEPRQALVLAYHEGLTHAELAQRLRKPLGTIKAWLRRSLVRLKDCLGEVA